MQSNWRISKGTSDMKLKAGLGPDGQKNPQRQVRRNTVRVGVTIEAKPLTEEQGQSRKRVNEKPDK